jgi:formyltetrahydrofolate synthetase
MQFDPTKMPDWKIAELAEEKMKTLDQLAGDLGLAYGELLPVGQKLAKIDYVKILRRLKHARRGKYIDVTAITPTPLGEGKTTTTIGLVQGLGRLKKNVIGTIRQPSSGPTFNIKGSAAYGSPVTSRVSPTPTTWRWWP